MQDKKKANASEKKSTKVGDNPSTSGRRTPAKGSEGQVGGKRPPDPGTDPPPPTKGIRGVPGSKNDSRRCHAKANRTGERCKRAAIKGGTVCTTHGGATPQAKRSARERLLELVDPALAALHKVLSNPDAEDSVKVRAALGILDRTGFGPGQTVTLQASKWDDLIGELFTESTVPLDRGLPDGNRPAIDDGGGAAEQFGYDATQEAWREYDHEDAEAVEQGRIRPDENTVRGEVVDYPNGPLNPVKVDKVRGSEFDPKPQERYGQPRETREEMLLHRLKKDPGP